MRDNLRLLGSLLCGVVLGLSAAHIMPCAWIVLRKKKKEKNEAEISKNEKLRLQYFDIPALGEPIRVLLSLGRFNWIDERVAYNEWPEIKPKTKWGQLPILLTENNYILTQSKSICRYLAKLVVIEGSRLYPDDPALAFRVDELMDALEDVRAKIMPTIKIADAIEKERQRKKLFAPDGECTILLKKINHVCGSDGHMLAGRFTLADIWTFFFFSLLRCGFLDGIPANALDQHTRLCRVHRRIADLPQVKAYYTRQAEENPAYAAFLVESEVSRMDISLPNDRKPQ
mmetsp:Transcript_19157/g.24855  ORF Transcript_19157/g.24855 Transcript_19157/m.24855 type:complete len:286 (+) Transcript_19157:49-906(+)